MAVIEIRVEIEASQKDAVKAYASAIADEIREIHEQFSVYKRLGFTGEPVIEIKVNGETFD